MNTEIRIDHSQVSERNIVDLLDHRFSIYVVKNFFSPEHCQKMTEEMKKKVEPVAYSHEETDPETGELLYHYYGVDRFGEPFNDTYSDLSGKKKELYYQKALETIHEVRSLSPHGVTPIDRLRLQLDESFVNGAIVGNFEGRKMLAGIVRFMDEELSHLSDDQPHFDWLPSEVKDLEVQLAANVYLETPKEGGELELWADQSVEESFAPPEKWRDILPKESLTYKPEIGDLVIFPTRKPHAIKRFEGGSRVSMQAFLGYKKNEPLYIWN